MKYNFDSTLDHSKNGSFRWDRTDGRQNIIGMDTADLDYFCAPCIKERLLKVAEENTYNYRMHSQEYYDAVTGWYKKNYGLALSPDWLSNVPSTIGAVKMAIDMFTEKGDYVLVQYPCFDPIARSINLAGCRILENKMTVEGGRYLLDFDDFEKKIIEYRPKVFVLINPHNPTCRVFSKDELAKVVHICYEHDVKIISDEVHSLVMYDGNVHTPILAVSEEARKIAVQIVSCSKGFNIMGLPHAIIAIADDSIRKEWQHQIDAYSFGYAVNAFAIEAVTSIMEGEADDWLKELNEYLDVNRKEMLAFLDRKDIPLHAFRPEGSFLIWVDCREAGIPCHDLDKFFLDKMGISLDDGKPFGDEFDGFVRINFAVTNKVLKEAIARMEKFFTC